MKKTNKFVAVLTVLAVLVSFCCLTSCKQTHNEANLWDNATYTEDTTLGGGKNSILLEVVVFDESVNLTIKTDKTTLLDVLTEHKIIQGRQEKIGYYIDAVNGIAANWEKDQSYWAFYVNNEYAMVGIDQTEVKDGAIYKLEYTK